MTKKEIVELIKKNNNKNEIIYNCEHEISLEEISCFWGGISISNKCIFCERKIENSANEAKVTFQIQYDEYGDIIDPHYSLSSIYNIIEEILEKYNDDEKIDLVKEIELLDLDNVKINKNQKVRKRQV